MLQNLLETVFVRKLTSMAGANASATTANESLSCRLQTLSDDLHIMVVRKLANSRTKTTALKNSSIWWTAANYQKTSGKANKNLCQNRNQTGSIVSDAYEKLRLQEQPEHMVGKNRIKWKMLLFP